MSTPYNLRSKRLNTDKDRGMTSCRDTANGRESDSEDQIGPPDTGADIEQHAGNSGVIDQDLNSMQRRLMDLELENADLRNRMTERAANGTGTVNHNVDREYNQQPEGAINQSCQPEQNYAMGRGANHVRNQFTFDVDEPFIHRNQNVRRNIDFRGYPNVGYQNAGNLNDVRFRQRLDDLTRNGIYCNPRVTVDAASLPIFSGNPKFLPTDFLINIESWFGENNVNYVERMAWMRKALKGDALLWFEVLGTHLHDYAAFRRAFLEKFWSQERQQEILAEIYASSYVRNGRSEMAAHFLRYVKRARGLDWNLSEQSLIGMMARHYPTEVARALLSMYNPTISAAFSLLEKYDDLDNRDFKNKLPSGQRNNPTVNFAPQSSNFTREPKPFIRRNSPSTINTIETDAIVHVESSESEN